MRRKDAGCTTFARQKFLFFSYTLFFSFLFFFPFISALSFTSGYTRQSRGYRVRFIVFSPACDDLNLILGLLSVFVYIIYIMCAYVCLYVYYTRARGSLKSQSYSKACAPVRLSLCEFESTEASCVCVCVCVSVNSNSTEYSGDVKAEERGRTQLAPN